MHKLWCASRLDFYEIFDNFATLIILRSATQKEAKVSRLLEVTVMSNANIMTVLVINCREERKNFLSRTLRTQSGEALALNIRETFLSASYSWKKIFRDNFQSLSTKILNCCSKVVRLRIDPRIATSNTLNVCQIS